jgi:SAM-dependent MidA family methyltransferase
MPERFDHFMARANAAYYGAKNPFADFVTAPELTQVFGEILGGWAKIVWRMLGAPEEIILAEAGPGRGLLMADALRVFGPVPVHFIETSQRLRAEQRIRVPGAIWHDSLVTVPDQPMVLFANEFLDALPVRQFVKRASGWMERYVAEGAYLEQPALTDLPDDGEGSVREVNEAAIAFVEQLARRGAIALLIDYGPLTSAPGETVQAIRAGSYADPLEAPGAADLTAHVDFAALAQAARKAGADVQGPVKQNLFLTALGLHQRTDILASRAPGSSAKLHLAARRLTAPEAMGSLFKAMAICPKGFSPLPRACMPASIAASPAPTIQKRCGKTGRWLPGPWGLPRKSFAGCNRCIRRRLFMSQPPGRSAAGRRPMPWSPAKAA